VCKPGDGSCLCSDDNDCGGAVAGLPRVCCAVSGSNAGECVNNDNFCAAPTTTTTDPNARTIQSSTSEESDVECNPATCESLGCGNGQDDGCGGTVDCGECCEARDFCNEGECGLVDDGCGGQLDCGDCPEPPVVEEPAATCIAEGDRCVNDEQCCDGLCRGRNCLDRGTKLCQAACAA
jgi:hypothetical protein